MRKDFANCESRATQSSPSGTTPLLLQMGNNSCAVSKNEPDLIIEVKTTDYVTVRLEKIAEYKEKLLAESKVSKDASILIVVGREDTGALEAQVRGSRYAWDMRL